MNFKIILNLMFKEIRLFYKDYKLELVSLPEGYIQEFSKNENSVKILFDQVNFRILNISENVEHLSGHSVKDLKNKSIASFLGFTVFNHITFLHVWLKWGNDICKKYYSIPSNPTTTFCGVKVKHKDGHIMSLMIRQTGLEFLDNGAIKITVITVDDISHLLRSDFYWGRTEFGDDQRIIHHIHSVNKNDIPQDIITDREKEVLRFIAKGMESKEIGKELFLSNHTIDNHRRNMIAKTGARDSTALVQICRMAGII